MMDHNKVKEGFSMVLEGLGVDRNDPHFKDSPERIAKAWTEELCVGMKTETFNVTTFPMTKDDQPGMIILQHIPVKSLCAHHLLPFIGEATVAYIPNELLCGLSKLSRIVDFFARKPQVQEHLTSDIASYLKKTLKPQGVGVIIKASHMCMEMRGVNHNGLMTTSALSGIFLKDGTSRAEFMALAHAQGSHV
ncbi:MAG: GTP cyclohydrolase I FolE [SAR324 cluster bacterium]|nr:GTP cyclohydrolase I FolE [SAR324 cluster bacterium]